ncbi:type VI secretion system baseplate subunit TssE [Acetobacter sp.]|jgi:type VI secretion system protein ImpF|uniref:type VI secretion system baseplate subunit TssE n=1 Tax=Acetobacter sp. TaxID=440 RepID=UPI0025C514D3|nr:type VI secretion system baseplate subunit TssE [Acetobacter sp.]MCH4092639.1 type VI secretion system baseplate subunit TssE [Acetobacter sp.]MCI1299773.1 type VI secretion system baseplate subunit TssE [Acetobacter sp.]MCI1315347.1 type VI secretion system baseplate subunit TssE [Acetobacter sp.]
MNRGFQRQKAVTERVSGDARPLRFSVLDRLLTAESDRAGTQDARAGIRHLQGAVLRDLTRLLNSRRPWHEPAPEQKELRRSPVTYGVPDFTSGELSERENREYLRMAIEETITRFETRLKSVRVALLEEKDSRHGVLKLRIDAVLHVEPLRAAVRFDTVISLASSHADVLLNETR